MTPAESQTGRRGSLLRASEDRAEELFETVAVGFGPQVSALVDELGWNAGDCASRIDTGMNPLCDARKAAATSSFSSGSLEQVA